MTIRRLPLISLALAIAIALLPIMGRSSAQAGPARSSSHQPTNVYFILNWLSNVEFAGLWVAQQKGWWKQAGLNMTFKPWANGVAPETDVPAKGGNTFGFQSGAAIGIARAQGVPDVAVYTDTQHSVFALTVLASSKIHKLTDLKGKSIGYQSHEFYVPATMMAHVGIPQSQWKPVVVGFDTTQLTSGHVDAYLTFLTNEPIALKLAGVPTRSFAASDYGFHFYDDVMFTTDSLIKSNPALVKKVVGVVARGFQWAHSHPMQTAKLTVDKYFPAPRGTSAALNLKQQQLEIKQFTPFSRTGPNQFHGTMKASYWRDSINDLFKYGLIKSKPSVSSLFTNRFNPYK